MRLALVCPEFPPEPGGLADYVARLSDELARQGHEVAIWAAPPSPLKRENILVHSHSRPWTSSKLAEIEKQISHFQPDALIAQFTPYLYGRRGLCPHWVYWISGLQSRLQSNRNLPKQASQCQVALMVHELHYPLGISPDRLILGTGQWIQFASLFSKMKRVAFTNELPLKRYESSLLNWQKKKHLCWLPAGATIEPRHSARIDLAKDQPPAPGLEKVLLQFGGAHPSRLFRPSFLALSQALESGIPARLVLLGLSPEAALHKLREEKLEGLAPSVLGTGYLSEAETSAWLKKATVVLAPFSDGVSARRSSVISAFAHGKSVVTNQGISTDPSINWASFCAISPGVDDLSMNENTQRLLRDPELANSLGQKAFQFFQNQLSWPVLANRMLHWLTQSQ